MDIYKMESLTSRACSKEFFSLTYLKFIFSYRKKINFKLRLNNLMYK